ncbi:MAG: YicC/YloC family endoribonuclease [Gammaproteobacteria bacterium]
MIRSMTAFAREGRDTPWGLLVWELRSVNSRYLDLSLRLPDELRGLDPAVRERIAAMLSRGKVEATLKYQPKETTVGLAVDHDAARALLHAADDVYSLKSDLSPLGVVDVLRWPGVLKGATVDAEALARAALEALDRAAAQLTDMRAREGARIKEMIDGRVREVRALVDKVVPILPELTQGFRQRLIDRLAEVKQSVDAARLEQEVVLFAQRADVAEEIDRLRAHCAEVERLLTRDQPVGRRLDFLMQELNREANTLGSKANDLRVTNTAVELKVLIEQMREQVQNVE